MKRVSRLIRFVLAISMGAFGRGHSFANGNPNSVTVLAALLEKHRTEGRSR